LTKATAVEISQLAHRLCVNEKLPPDKTSFGAFFRCKHNINVNVKTRVSQRYANCWQIVLKYKKKGKWQKREL